MKLFHWNNGRQNTGYRTFPVFLSSVFDLYLLHYAAGTGIPTHIDPIPNYSHYRVNIVIWNSAKGGKFNCTKCIFESARIKFFRPDISEHSVDTVTIGNRYVLSIGWAIPSRT